MSLIINHNISSINTQRNLERSSQSLAKSLQKLSSGYKINVAADDPSGLIISEQLRSQTISLERAVRNSQEASNVIGIAEGALIEINEMLRTLRGLAIHAANNGVTAPDQISADQSEIDSAIQTIDRIANTTKYSDQFLLNGSKGLIFDTEQVSGNQLLDTSLTRIDQVFKREGLTVGINYSGQSSTQGLAAMTRQAQRAIFEADTGGTGDAISATTGLLTETQSFIVTGTSGARQFSFSEGSDITQLVDSVENVSASTGVHAALVLGSGATATVAGAGFSTATDLTNFNIYGMQTGVNTDAQGQLFFEIAGGNTVNVYTDNAGANLVATGTYTGANETVVLTEQNDSGISGTVDTGTGPANFAVGATTNVSARALTDTTVNETNDSGAALSAWVLNGVEIGSNTDSQGKMHVEVVDVGAGNFRVDIYSDSDLSTLVAQSNAAAAGSTLTISEANSSGLAGTVLLDAGVAAAAGGIVLRPQLGARLYSEGYGSDKYVRVQATEGKMWEYYDDVSAAYVRVDATSNAITAQADGQDATIYINGSSTLVAGLDSEVTTPVFSGRLNFKEGSLHNTTIAQTGYERGNASSAIGDLFDSSNLAVNAGVNSAENITNIRNGMQYQLGETDGDQARTIYAIPSMSVPNLGRIKVDGVNYTLQDILGGGTGSLAKDPVVAMKVLTQAIDDVSSLRARLGAFQSNMLQTNINSLSVAVENITSTESAIRDANMATESSEYTKNQILVQTGTAMLAQANTVSQNVLQLLQ